MGGTIHKVTFDQWWEIIKTHRYNGMAGKFIHPVSDRAVIAGMLVSVHGSFTSEQIQIYML